MIGVAFLSAWRLAAPHCCCCAPAGTAIAPSTSATAVKVMVNFRIERLLLFAGLPRWKKRDNGYHKPFRMKNHQASRISLRSSGLRLPRRPERKAPALGGRG